MRLQAAYIHEVAGLEHVEISDLSDVVVFAGPNGVGKTRLINALIHFFQNPNLSTNIRLIIEATSETEKKGWGKNILNTGDRNDIELLRSLIQRNQKRNQYKSTVLNFDSNRAITQVRPFDFSWDFPDPYEEEVGWSLSYSFLRDRFQDVQHSLFKIVEGQKRKIAQIAVALMAEGRTSMPLDFPDPLEPFKKAFSQLLAPKTLLDTDAKNQTIYYEFEGNN